jgi:pyruvate,water dikinase
VKNKAVDLRKINSIYNFHICVPNDNGTVSVLCDKVADKFLKNIKFLEIKIKKDISEIKGTCAQPGKASGRVKIINSPADMHKMQAGDILVSTATTPSIVPAMKKSSAIVTDEGGLTCHASIVSREMKIPCVIGMKIATKVLKDGDLVEVDANKGIVKKI